MYIQHMCILYCCATGWWHSLRCPCVILRKSIDRTARFQYYLFTTKRWSQLWEHSHGFLLKMRTNITGRYDVMIVFESYVSGFTDATWWHTNRRCIMMYYKCWRSYTNSKLSFIYLEARCGTLPISSITHQNWYNIIFYYAIYWTRLELLAQLCPK